MAKRIEIEAMFDKISGKYDKLNNLLSFCTHWLWKKKLVKKMKSYSPHSILDGATGTGDIAFLCKDFCNNITGIDISKKMLAEAKKKFPEINFLSGDLCKIDFPKDSFDLSVVSFGVRNVEDLPAALAELERVTKKAVFILEFGTPINKVWKNIYFSIMKVFIPLTGLIFNDKKAYEYLIDSSMKFPSHQQFLDLCGTQFTKKEFTPIWGGIAYIYELSKERV